MNSCGSVLSIRSAPDFHHHKITATMINTQYLRQRWWHLIFPGDWKVGPYGDNLFRVNLFITKLRHWTPLITRMPPNVSSRIFTIRPIASWLLRFLFNRLMISTTSPPIKGNKMSVNNVGACSWVKHHPWVHDDRNRPFNTDLRLLFRWFNFRHIVGESRHQGHLYADR